MEYPHYIDVYEDIRLYIELTAVTAGAMSGSLHAQRRGFDFVGVVAIGITTGLGGGVIRDVLLGAGPVLVLLSSKFLITAITASLLGVLLFSSLAGPLSKFKWFLDSLTLGLFAVSGLQRAQVAGLLLVPSLLLGVVTCVGGGVIRDVLCRETPDLFLPGQPYTPPALLAGIVYLWTTRGLKFPALPAEMLAVAAAFAARLLTAWLGWELPTPPDLPREIQRRWRLRRPRPLDDPNQSARP